MEVDSNSHGLGIHPGSLTGIVQIAWLIQAYSSVFAKEQVVLRILS